MVSTLVGMAGFEPAASTSQMWRDTGLRYIPKIFLSAANIVFLLVSAGHSSNQHHFAFLENFLKKICVVK
jgi:hypothetical protein